MSKETLLTGEKSLRQTIQQTGKVLFGQNVPNYTLYFLDPTKTKGPGEFMVIVNPYIELGRASTNVIQYGEEFPTVSRKHASISFENGQVVVTSLGKNPTYVNGQEVQGKRILHNIDEIQLSSNGPRLRFNSDVTNTSSMKFTQRMSLMAEQALKPYRRLVAALSVLLLLAIGSGLWYGLKLNAENIAQDKVIKNLEIKNRDLVDESSAIRDTLDDLIKKGQAQSATAIRLKNRLYVIQVEQDKTNKEIRDLKGGKGGEVIGDGFKEPPIQNPEYPLRNFDNYIYFVRVKKISISVQGFNENKAIEFLDVKWSGTGFLSNEGDFITARHVLEGWLWFDINDECDEASQPDYMMLLNNLALKRDVTVTYEAISPKGDILTFTNNMIKKDDSSEGTVCGKYTRIPWQAVKTDWASINFPNRKGISNININRNFSKELKKGVQLLTSGYGRGIALQGDHLDPLFVKGTVAQDDLVSEVINVTGFETVPGHSGGPVFALNKSTGKYEVIGIVHGKYGDVGRVVPIWYVR